MACRSRKVRARRRQSSLSLPELTAARSHVRGRPRSSPAVCRRHWPAGAHGERRHLPRRRRVGAVEPASRPHWSSGRRRRWPRPPSVAPARSPRVCSASHGVRWRPLRVFRTPAFLSASPLAIGYRLATSWIGAEHDTVGRNFVVRGFHDPSTGSGSTCHDPRPTARAGPGRVGRARRLSRTKGSPCRGPGRGAAR